MTTDSGTAEYWVVIQPHDTVHVRDGRPMPGGEGGTATTVNPWPSTVAGAVAAALGNTEPDAVAGPILAKRQANGWKAYFPTPADLVTLPTSEFTWRMESPSDTAPASDLGDEPEGPTCGFPGLPDSLLKRTSSTKYRPLSGLLSSQGLTSYLHGEFPPGGRRPSPSTGWCADPIHEEARIGIGLDPQTRTVKDGMLYQAIHLRLDDGWAFTACLSPGKRDITGFTNPVRFGGLGRMADIDPGPSLGWPSAPAEFPDGRVLVYVVTPGVWKGGWRPPLPEGATLIGAKVDDPIPVASGSSSVNGKWTRTLAWAVPPGSVYYLKFADSQAAAAWAHEQHARALSPAARPRWDTAGFGVILTGVW